MRPKCRLRAFPRTPWQPGWPGTTRPRYALHRHLLHQPGRREMQGLWPQLRRSADVDRHGATTEARRMAQDHDRRRLLALYPLCRACGRARGHIAQTRLIAVYRTEPVRCCRRPNISPHAADRRFQPPPPRPCMRLTASDAGSTRVPAGKAWPATAARLRERDAARLNIGPRQAARS